MAAIFCKECDVQKGDPDWDCEHTLLGKLKEGDLIEIKKNLYSHWGVYVGSGEIVHFNALPQEGRNRFFAISSSSVVEEQGKIGPIKDAISMCRCRVNNTAPSSEAQANERTPQQIVQYALKKVNENEGKVQPYHILKENCEHFAKECRFGVQHRESRQVIAPRTQSHI